MSINFVFDIPHCLQAFRQSLATKAASDASDDVHARNRFFIIGRQMGLGLWIQEDRYKGSVEDSEIQMRLESIFDADYRPLAIMEQLYEELLSRFRSDGYRGALHEGSYEKLEYESWKQALEAFLSSGSLGYDEFLCLDEDYKIQDINHAFVKEQLFQRLNADYFNLSPELEALMKNIFESGQPFTLSGKQAKFFAQQPDALTLIRLSSDEHKQQILVTAYLKALKNDIERLKQCLQFLTLSESAAQPAFELLQQATIETLTKVLTPKQAASILFVVPGLDEEKQSALLDTALNDKLKNPQKLEMLLKLLAKQTHVPEGLYKETIKIYATDYFNAIFTKNQSRVGINFTIKGASLFFNAILALEIETPIYCYTYALKQIHEIYPEAIHSILNAMEKNLTKEQQAKILLQRCSDGWNALMLAVRYHPAVVQPILNAMEKNLTKEEQAKILLQRSSNGWNALMLAARYHPAAVQPILNAMEKNLTKEQQAEIFLQQNSNGWNALMMAALNQPEAIQPILNAMEKNLTKEQQAEILMQRSSNGWNALMMAALNQPEAIQPILNAMEKNLTKEQQAEILMQQNSYGSNALMLAARYQPEAVQPNLNGMLRTLTKEQHAEMLMKYSVDHWKILIQAACKHPESMKCLLQSMSALEKNQQLKLLSGVNNEHANHYRLMLEGYCRGFSRERQEALFITYPGLIREYPDKRLMLNFL